MEWNLIIAGAINSVLVLLVVQFLKIKIPGIREKAPWLFPVLAMVIGPLIALAQSALASWLGVPIDLSMIAGLFTGATATALHQIKVQSA